MKISIVIPVFNEEIFIENLLKWLVSVKPDEKEIFVIDGNSSDNTKKIVTQFSKLHSEIKLLENNFKYVSYSLNLAIPKCNGDIIVRLDAHTVYDDFYLTTIIETFNRIEADIVGGPMRAIGKTPFQTAVAIATSTIFGIGNSQFHNLKYEGYTDSVYLGAWKKEIFKYTGLFDTQMIRNQDDEFHYRAKSMGYKIYLNPNIISYYYPRNNISSLFKQYYQYGLYKPLVSRKIKSEIKIRHLIPMFFVLFLIGLPFLSFFTYFALLPVLIYILTDLLFSIFSKESEINVKCKMLFIFPIIHIAYGSGYLRGLFKLAQPESISKI